MAQGDKQQVRVRRVKLPAQVQERMARLLPGLAQLKPTEGVRPLNSGFFKLEQIRWGDAVRRRRTPAKKIKG